MVVGTAELGMDPAGLLAWEAAAVLGKLVTSRGLKNHKNLLCLSGRETEKTQLQTVATY